MSCTMAPSCSFCMKTNEKFEVIGAFTRDIQNVFSLKLKFDERKTSLICSTCSGKLKAVLEFKSMCLATSDTIFPYIHCAEEVKLDLREIYMKEIENRPGMDLPDDQKICSLCLQQAQDEFIDILEDQVNTIRTFVPEMNIGIIKNPIICKLCLDFLNTHNNFLNDCFGMEMGIEIDVKKEVKEVKYEEISIKSEIIDIKFAKQQNSDMVPLRSHNETVENIDCRGVEEGLKCTWKDKSRPIPSTDSQTDASSSSLCIKTENLNKGLEINDVETSIKTECVDIKSEDEGRDISSLSVEDEPVDYTSDWVPECITTSDTDCFNKRIYKCDSCEYIAKRKDHVARHRLTHKERIYKCDWCEYKTGQKKCLKWHQRRHKEIYEGQTYKCDWCSYQTVYKVHFMNHQLRHKDITKIEMYRCDLCKYKTYQKQYLAKHQRRHNYIPEEQMYKCDECDFKTVYKESFTRHLLLHKDIPEEKMHKCDCCEYKTHQKSRLVRHQLRHKGEQTYKCDWCDYKTYRKEYFVKHQQRKHRDIPEEQMHKCDHCDFKTIYKQSFTQHQLRHKKDIPEEQMYKCDWCEYKTIQKQCFAKHQRRKHRDIPEEQMYKCDECDFKTIYKESFTRHQQRHGHIPK